MANDKKKAAPAMVSQASSEEEKILEYWDKQKVFERSVEQRSAEKSYVFYDGPPFATGLPHYGHLLSSIIKDVVPRFWTMKGYRVERRWGWDCHGIPIENMIEQELDLKGGKKGIEDYGIANFNSACRAAILRFDKEWEKTIRRIARWVNFSQSYKTMDNSYMESVWWGFKKLHENGFVYEGRRVILYCPRCATPLSNFEIAMDNSYKEVEDHSVFVKFRAANTVSAHTVTKGRAPWPQYGNEYFVAWTTTPWTLPGNVALAVDESADYVKMRCGEEYLWAAEKLQEEVKKRAGAPCEVVETVKGSALVGREYEPLYSYMPTEGKKAYYVVGADFVSLEDGTGIVHTAAVFGEDDYRLALARDLPAVPTLDEQGRFLDFVEPLKGMFYKKGESWVVEDLTNRGLMLKAEKIRHSYPMCYRCSTPLYFNAVPAWFIDIQKLKPKMSAENKHINWYPEHLKNGRFGKGIDAAPDWNISRSRYWGTPMPVWVGEKTGVQRLIGSFDELKEWAVDSSAVEKLTDYHREFIDPIEVWVDDARTEKGKRIPEVFDCWIESGSMPFASVHAPFENNDWFKKHFPAQFITEYIAQTRAWFYVTHVLSVGLFGSHGFENVLTTGTILAEDGTKMSKSKKNYPDPTIVIDKYGADVVRLYIMSQAIVNGENMNFSEKGVDEVSKKFLTILKNVLAFYQLYASHDDRSVVFGDGNMPAHVLDRWVLARLEETRHQETAAMEAYNLSEACRVLQHFVTDLSTWYVRRSRDRVKQQGQDRTEALATLRSVLETLAKLIAPFTPFFAETVFQTLEGGFKGQSDRLSVHLESWPESMTDFADEKVLADMGRTRSVVSRALEARAAAGIAIRQVLPGMRVQVPGGKLDAALMDVIKDELNVKDVQVVDGEYEVVLDTKLTPELLREGLVRDIIRQVNALRKEAKLTIQDRIALAIKTDSLEVKKAIDEHTDALRVGTLSNQMVADANDHTKSMRIQEQDLMISFDVLR